MPKKKTAVGGLTNDQMTRPEKIFSVTLALPNFNQVTQED